MRVSTLTKVSDGLLIVHPLNLLYQFAAKMVRREIQSSVFFWISFEQCLLCYGKHFELSTTLPRCRRAVLCGSVGAFQFSAKKEIKLWKRLR